MAESLNRIVQIKLSEITPAQLPRQGAAIERLFVESFGAAEGEEEGARIGELVREMMASTDPEDLYGFVAADGATITGAIFFTRLNFESALEVFILSPVAVASRRQGTGIGQALINFGLGEIKRHGVSYVITYGDPAFYSKLGFHPISPQAIRPPLALSQPEGWLGQSLTGETIDSIPGDSTCVKALNNPVYW